MRNAFLGTWIALTVVQIAWWHGSLPALLIAVVPLLAVGATLVRPTGRRRAIASLLSLPYFTVGTTEWMVDRETLAALTVLCCTVLYLLIVAVNVRSRAAPDR